MANAMESMTEWMNAHIAPLAGRLGQNKVIQAISNGMMCSMPITIGVALVAIIINLPIAGVSDWLAAIGITAAANEPVIFGVPVMLNPTFSLIVLICMASSVVLYAPFFQIADQQAYEEEQAILAAKVDAE